MRLINTMTGAFEEFIGRNIPKYAILSHTWGEEEVTYEDYRDGAYLQKKGSKKIIRTLQEARKSGLSYAWVDTCCIDKSSSAELTEAINSMYRWYERSQECYVYLSDLKAGADLAVELSHCRWFSRGWTLQELIAPGSDSTHFFDSRWSYMGSKWDLHPLLSLITGINAGILSHDEALSSICVARKMSWAANRVTTRIEDMAYCLLGLFGVNMPLLYGEEYKAFRRLQEEIIKTNSDLSIFAWKVEPSAINTLLMGPDLQLHCGILAQSPDPFKHTGSSQTALFGGSYVEFSICNIGVKTNSVFRLNSSHGMIYILPLYCRTAAGTDLAVRLRKIGLNTFVRYSPYNLNAYKDMLLQHENGDCYVLIDQPPTRNTLARAPCAPTEASWTQLSVNSRRHSFLRFQLAGMLIRREILGCFDSEEEVFFVPEGDQTDCAAVSFSVQSPKNAIGNDPGPGSRFILLALGWSTDIKTTQYTVIDYVRWRNEISNLKGLLTQGANTQTELLRRLSLWDIPKVSSAVDPIRYPIAGTEQSTHIRVSLEYASRTIRISCDILNTEDIAFERPVPWEWDE